MGTKSARDSVLLQNLSNSDLDSIDLSIIRTLQRKGRATNEEVGEAAGLSSSAASRRIHALELRGIIAGYQAIIENKLLGTEITVFVRVTLERQSANALHGFESAIRRCHSVISCHLMAGEYDYMLQIKVASMSDFERVHKEELSRFPGVSRLESSFAVRDVIERQNEI